MSAPVSSGPDSAVHHRSTVKSIGKAFTLYRLLQTANGPMRLSDLSRRAELAKSTTHRLLQALVTIGVVRRFGTGYLVAPSDNGNAAHDASRLRRLAPYVSDLFMRTQMTSGLAVLDGIDVVFAHRVYGHDHVWTHGDDLRRERASSTAAGRLLLAHDLHNTFDAAEAWGLPADEVAPLNRELMRIRRRGFAVMEGVGRTSLAVRVPTPTDQPPAALVVQGRTEVIDLDRILLHLRLTAHAAGQAASPRLAGAPAEPRASMAGQVVWTRRARGGAGWATHASAGRSNC
ncbi:helix-turn-helix domain-containing protein [Streptomyces canus]|uniref:IclR family transcriptional regulator n=1 Tax=Streptomyces canus TaxID=58343 RepID=UPI0033F99A13